eukprot:682729_1
MGTLATDWDDDSELFRFACRINEAAPINGMSISGQFEKSGDDEGRSIFGNLPESGEAEPAKGMSIFGNGFASGLDAGFAFHEERSCCEAGNCFVPSPDTSVAWPWANCECRFVFMAVRSCSEQVGPPAM